MWKEWLYPYNAFNSIKALVFRERLGKILDWHGGGKTVLPPPVTVTIDPTNLCNVNCFWCKNREFRQRESRSISDSQLLEIPEFLKDWGVKSVMISGGEPLLHPKITEFLNALGAKKIPIGLKTNGILLVKPALRKAVLAHVDWIAFSVDAASSQTYLRAKKATVNSFEKLLANIKWLVDNREVGKPRITLKYLIHHLTFSEMYAFVNMGKLMKVDEIHFRPLYLDRYKYAKGVRKTAGYYLREARKDFESDNFRVYGIVSKFEREWERAIRFKDCLASPLSGVFAADGKFYLCTDRRGDDSVSLGKFYPFMLFKKKWGSEEHRKMATQITPQLCPKCGMTGPNEVAERCILKDEMFLDFV